MDQRNRGAAVLLVSEDLDEILELADRVAVMSEGGISYVAATAETDRNTIGTTWGAPLMGRAGQGGRGGRERAARGRTGPRRLD